jgi:hypothetical protein
MLLHFILAYIRRTEVMHYQSAHASKAYSHLLHNGETAVGAIGPGPGSTHSFAFLLA